MKQPGYLKALLAKPKAETQAEPEVKLGSSRPGAAGPSAEPGARPMASRHTDRMLTLFQKDLDFEPLTIKGVHITSMSEEELAKLSVVTVKNEARDEAREKFAGTVSDERMFPHTTEKPCSTCELPRNFCPGHLGKTVLFKPILHIWFLKYILFVLDSICIECGTLLLNIDTVKRLSKAFDGLKRVATASKDLPCRNQKCEKRDQPNPKFTTKHDNMLKIQMTYPDSKTRFISSTKILNLFKSISIDELEALGFSQKGLTPTHPKDMLISSLSIIPQNHRPDNIVNDKKTPNSLTGLYREIIKTNNYLSSGIKDDRWNAETLESKVTSIYARDSEANRGGNPNIADTSKNIDEILGKKKGLIRSKGQGKSCDRTGRTVLGPGGLDVPFGFISLPDRMKKLLIEEKVCDYNLAYFNNLLEEGSIMSIRTQNEKMFPANRQIKFVLKPGMTVRRLLQEGDVVFFNRNPTLSKVSFMAYIVKFDGSLTIKIHSSVTAPLQADFDGDEGNIHVCQDYHSRAEMIHLSSCWNHIIGSDTSRPILGLLYNAITGCYLMSRHGKIADITWEKYINTVFKTSSRLPTLQSRVNKRRPGAWKTGPALFSALLPEDFFYTHSGVQIEEGVLIKGDLKKAHVGPSSNSIVHKLYLEYGTQTVSQFISEGQFLADRFIQQVGFTVGYRDCSMPSEEAMVKEIVEKKMEEARQKLLNLSSLVGNPNVEIHNFYSNSVQAAVGEIKTAGKQIVKDALTSNNSLKVMADSGSRGNDENIAEIIGIVGQQFVDGDRPELTFNNGLRFLPYYDIAHEGIPEKIINRGFVSTSLAIGMRPGNFVAHMMSSRISLIDAKLGTPITGHNMHVMSKAIEDIRYSYNGTICNDIGVIVQYAGGYDSYEPKEMSKVKIPGFGDIWSPIDIESIVNKLNLE
jgi:DNA-directed RNA polymerase II subunit RPB1